MAVRISPAQVRVMGWDTLAFQLMDGTDPVPAAWTIEPSSRGTMTKDGIYTSPKWIFVSRTAIVRATADDARLGSATATVELSNLRALVTVLCGFLTLMAGGLLVTLFLAWPRDSAVPPPLAIGPASVVLKKGETQTFVSGPAVKWSDNAPSGVFTADIDGGVVRIFATRTEGADRTAAATITIGNTSLTVNPPLPVLRSREAVQLVATTTAKDPIWSSEICTPGGMCTAPANLAEERIVIATVRTKDPILTASIPIRLLPNSPSTITMMLFAMLFGALGGLVHATNSLVSYVGSSKFVGTWGLFYLVRPFVGAVMALFVYLLFKGQLAADTVRTSDLVAVAAISGLVGLFSDRAAEKLREIFDVVIGPKNDSRSNKLGTGTGVAKPTIIEVKPPAVAHGTISPPLVVKGSGFADKCKGLVNGQARPTTFQSEAQVTIALEPADVASVRSLTLTIVNPNGDTSAPATVLVT